MNTQQEKLSRQLAHVEEEMKILVQKSKRIQFRYQQLEKEREALKADLSRSSNQTTKRQELSITQVRKMNLLTPKTPPKEEKNPTA